MNADDVPDTCHPDPIIVSLGSERWQAVCLCRHRTPYVADRATAHQAHQAHLRDNT